MSAASVTPAAAPRSGSERLRTLVSVFRMAAALGLAGAVTFTLFMLMQALIASDTPPAQDAPEPVSVTIRFDPPEMDTPRGPRTFDVVSVQAPPPAPRLVSEASARPVETGFQYTRPPIENETIMQGMDTIALPPPPLSTRVEPIYPRRELSRGVQGDCTVRYDILASGRTANVSVLACDSSGFERASLEAVADWRHAAVQGRAGDEVVRRGVTTTLSFRLAE